MRRARFAHLLEEIEFDEPFWLFINAREAVGAEAKVDAGGGQPGEWEGLVFEVEVAARTMDDMNFAPAQQRGVAGGQIIDMNGQQVWAEGALPLQMLDGGAEAAIGHVAAIAGEPVEHFPAARGKHLELLVRLGQMNGQSQPAPAGGVSGEPEQSGRGGVWGVRGKSGGAAPLGEGLNEFHGLTENFARRAAAFEAGHFQERKDSQRRGGPDFGQQFRHRLNVPNGGGAGAQKHFCPFQPGHGKIGEGQAGLAGEDELEPVGEFFCRGKLAGQGGVVEMAMGVDQPGQGDDFAQIDHGSVIAAR